MKISKIITLAAAVPVLTLASCSNDDEPTPQPEFIETVSGIYVVNNGVQTGNIPGGITSVDATTGSTVDYAFSAANGVQIGDTPQSAVIYGSKMYIAVTESNIIWVVNAGTLKILNTIQIGDGMSGPREFAAHEGKIYASLYSGHIARIDTTSMTIDKTLAVGPNPEGLAAAGNRLYVANSDGLNWQNGNANCSVSIVDLTAWTQKEVKMGYNPTKVVSNGTDVFVLCMGNYSDIPATVKKINGENATDFCPATMMALRGNELYAVDAPSPASATYKVYNTATGAELRTMVTEGVESPSGLAVDNVTGRIVLLSYKLNADGWSLYSDPCYGRLYNADGSPLMRFDTGVGSICAVFRHTTVAK